MRCAWGRAVDVRGGHRADPFDALRVGARLRVDVGQGRRLPFTVTRVEAPLLEIRVDEGHELDGASIPDWFVFVLRCDAPGGPIVPAERVRDSGDPRILELEVIGEGEVVQRRGVVRAAPSDLEARVGAHGARVVDLSVRGAALLVVGSVPAANDTVRVQILVDPVLELSARDIRSEAVDAGHRVSVEFADLDVQKIDALARLVDRG